MERPPTNIHHILHYKKDHNRGKSKILKQQPTLKQEMIVPIHNSLHANLGGIARLGSDVVTRSLDFLRFRQEGTYQQFQEYIGFLATRSHFTGKLGYDAGRLGEHLEAQSLYIDESNSQLAQFEEPENQLEIPYLFGKDYPNIYKGID